MKISLLVNYDLASRLAIELLCRQLPNHQLSIFYTRKSTPANLPSELLDLGKFEHAYLDQNGFLGSTHHNVLKISQSNSINIGGYEALKASQPDLLISVRHMSILKDMVIGLPKHGVINLHSGLLPQYQGVMATLWATLAGEKQLGSSLHFIEDSTIDTGRIIEQAKVAMQGNHSYLWNVLKLYRSGCEMVVRAVNLIENDQPIKAQQQRGAARYYSYPDQAVLDKFMRLGKLYEKDDLHLLEETNNSGV